MAGIDPDLVGGGSQRVGRRAAIVIGAGMAGLLAARVLADSFEHVALIEADELPDQALPRKGTPQCEHVHALLKSGEGVLSGLYPGLKDALRAGGGHEFSVRSRWRFYGPGGWPEPADVGLTMLAQTRPMLEQIVRERTLRRPEIQLLRGRVRDLEGEGEVSGVVVEQDGEKRRLEADLVVDATGRGGRTTTWLRDVGRMPPREELMRPDLRYTSALFSRRLADGPDFGGWLMFLQPPDTRSAVAIPVEGGAWQVTVGDRFGGSVPPDEGAVRAFLQALPDPKLATLLRDERPLTAFRTYRVADVRIRRFDERLEELPRAYLPIGDAIATFNPIYAQGISVAALQAQALAEALAAEESLEEAARSYLVRAMEPALWAWRLGQASDLRYEQVEGERTAEVQALADSIRRLFEATVRDPSLQVVHARAIHLLEPPESIARALAAKG